MDDLNERVDDLNPENRWVDDLKVDYLNSEPFATLVGNRVIPPEFS